MLNETMSYTPAENQDSLVQDQRDITSLFSTDLSGVDPNLPLLAPSDIVFRIDDCKVLETKDKTSQNLTFSLSTVYPQMSTKGKTLEPGYKLTHYVSLKPVDKEGRDRKDQLLRTLRGIMDAVGRTGQFGDPASYIGSQIKGAVLVESDASGKYADKNTIKRFIAK